ncbi:dihydrodipicolinate synthase family protein, partial [Streptomyces sp. MK37H]|nr:dihydrodipicolinate synthase family protein [Streptomyces sp. MK37H]
MPDLSAPWHGVHVATALPFHDDDELSVDYEGYAAHVRFLAEH